MKTQAWGWLAAAVLAAGLNSSYHEGGLAWVHRMAGQIDHNTGAVLALATGHADRFLAEARMLSAAAESSNAESSEQELADALPLQMASTQRETPSCRWSTAMTRVRVNYDLAKARFEEMSARREAEQDRMEAARDRLHARIEEQVDESVSRIHIPAVAMSPIVVRAPRIACSRIEVKVPQIPAVRIPEIRMPEIRVPQVRVPEFSIPSAPAIQINLSGPAKGSV
ncbi:MAG TPA: hypothetical protein VMD76_14835 [Candidatus Sulfotelmatobacter sp.]|nr:hypothetical protein [Candidatus Sulfotelmatobacter sp.]